MQKISLPFLLLFYYGLSTAQTIPFELTKLNAIIFQSVLNNQDTVRLMFHTGASDVTLIEEKAPSLKTIHFTDKVDSVSSWGGADNTSEYSLKNSIQIGNINASNITVWKDKLSGRESDGKFGLDLFAKSCVKIDFDKKRMTITKALPKNLKHYLKFELSNKRGMYFIKANCVVNGKIIANEFMLHTGYSGAVLLDDEFVSNHKLSDQIPITGEKKLQDAFGNIITTKNGILPLINLGEIVLKDIPVGFFEGTMSRQSISIIGSDIFKKFNWVIDAERKYVYIKPNKYFKSNYINL